ncbi:hypothetical protein [Halomonas sp. hl-4]|uniref:hypothetical protein n=1 Tax=Halomonas sp. hl-4 TaxID=1761789 RepID=UPI000BBFCF25|nr:hypothetical protein [Halomonas sp. hl-4]SNY98302.1 hypothetical protein SAMN04488142_2924 [Halomonas sp. hl-4]
MRAAINTGQLTDRDIPLALHDLQHLFPPPAPLPANSVSERISRFVFITHNVAPESVAELYSFFHSSQELTGFQLKVVHAESLHAHNAVACSEWNW